MSVHSASAASGSPRAAYKAGGAGFGTHRRSFQHQRGHGSDDHMMMKTKSRACTDFSRKEADKVLTASRMSPLARDALTRLRAEADGTHKLASGNDVSESGSGDGTSGEEKRRRRRRRFILGSGSASRRALLENAGLKDFDVAVPHVDELDIGVEERETNQSEKLVTMLAETKANALIDRGVGVSVRAADANEAHADADEMLEKKNDDDDEEEEDVLLLTGDSVVTFHGTIREKPRDRTEAREFIASYSNDCCTTVSAVCVHNLRTGKRRIETHRATVHFNEIPDHKIEALCEDGQVLKCAGGLMVEHPLVDTCIDRIEGGIDAVMGLCITTVAELMDDLAT